MWINNKMYVNEVRYLAEPVDWKKVREECRSRGNTQYVCGCPPLDIEETKKSWEAYDIKALPGMLEWVQTARPRNGQLFQYDEVLEKLREYNPPCCHEFTFVRKLLFPELSKRGVQNFPLDLVAILYTLGVPCRQCTFISAVIDRDPVSGLETEDLFLQFRYEDTGRVWSYRVHNFKHPEIAKLEVVE